MDPAAQAQLLQPLRRLAGAMDAQGRTRWASTYTGVEIDAIDDVVDLFTTDPASARALLAAARRAMPDARWDRVRTRGARYSSQRSMPPLWPYCTTHERVRYARSRPAPMARVLMSRSRAVACQPASRASRAALP